MLAGRGPGCGSDGPQPMMIAQRQQLSYIIGNRLRVGINKRAVLWLGVPHRSKGDVVGELVHTDRLESNSKKLNIYSRKGPRFESWQHRTHPFFCRHESSALLLPHLGTPVKCMCGMAQFPVHAAVQRAAASASSISSGRCIPNPISRGAGPHSMLERQADRLTCFLSSCLPACRFRLRQQWLH